MRWSPATLLTLHTLLLCLLAALPWLTLSCWGSSANNDDFNPGFAADEAAGFERMPFDGEDHPLPDGEEPSEEEIQKMMEKLNMQQGQERRFSRDIPYVEEDVPLVQCDTCKLLVKKLAKRVQDRREKLKKTKTSETDIMDMVAKACDTMEEEGEWITEYDAVETTGEDGQKRLTLKRMGGPGHCEEECKTVERACSLVLATYDSEIAEALYLSKADPEEICAREELRSSLKGSCGLPYPAWPADRKDGGDNFRAKSVTDIAMAKVNREMRAMQDKLGARAFEL